MSSWSVPYLQLIMIAAAALTALVCLFAHLFMRKKKDALEPRSPPGPPGLPILGNLLTLGALPHRDLRKMAEEHGPVMRIKLGLLSCVVVSSSCAAELFLSDHNKHGFVNRPSGDIVNYLYGRKGMQLAEYGPYWRGVRKLCNLHLLCSRKVDLFRPVRSEEARRFLRSIRDATAGGRMPVDLSARVSALVMDMVCRMMMGKKCREARVLEKIIREVLELSGAFNVADYIPCIGPLDVQGIRRRIKAVSKAFDDFFETVIDEHALGVNEGNKPEKDLDIVHMMLRSMGSDELLNDRSCIKAILMDLMVASTDTSAVTVEWTMTELLRHPRVMRKLQRELEDAVGMHRTVEEEDLANLSYLDMVIKESMRLHPPLPLFSREATRDSTVGGFHIRKGTIVLVNLWAIGRDPGYWDDAEAFFPERFAGRGGGAEEGVDGHSSAFPAFGLGSRRCPGLHMGLTMVRIVVAQLVHCFNWEIPGGVPHGELDTTEAYGIVAGRANHLLAVPTYRLHCGDV